MIIPNTWEKQIMFQTTNQSTMLGKQWLRWLPHNTFQVFEGFGHGPMCQVPLQTPGNSRQNPVLKWNSPLNGVTYVVLFVLNHGFGGVQHWGMENGLVRSYLNPSNTINRKVFGQEICLWLGWCWVCCAMLIKHYPSRLNNNEPR